MGEDGYGLPLMLFRNFSESCKESTHIHIKGLAPLYRPGLRAVREGIVPLMVAVIQPAEGLILPNTHGDLTEARICLQRQTLGLINGSCRNAGTGQVTGIDRINMDITEPLFQSGDLLPSVGGNEGIILSLESAEYITLRLPVSDQI
jgi:hypothetical protein